MTGTIRLPEGSAAAMPMLMSFLMMMRVPSMEALIIGKSRIARTTASMKIGVNVIFSPYCFLNFSLTLLRQLTMLVTSTSTKEVTCGLVCLLITMWSAMSLRMRSISTISTLPLMLTAGDCGTAGAVAGAETAGAAGMAVLLPFCRPET